MVSKLTRDTRGAAYVEFLISFIPVFLMFLGMVQMGLMFVGGLAVQRAASAAARAAIVVLDDDPQYYGGEGRMQIGGGSSSGPSVGEGLINFLGSSGVGGGDAGGMEGAGGSADTSDSARLSAIHNAASIPLFAVAPPPSAVVRPESVMAAIGNNSDPLGMPPSRLLSALVWNNTGALAVRLVDGPASRTDRTSFPATPLHGDDAVPTPARVRVTYLFHCGVPLANRLMCNDPLALLFGADAVALGRLARNPDRWSEISRQREADLRRQRQDEIPWSDLGDGARRGVAALGVGASLLGRSMRVKVMTAEAQLPIQYANYRYQSE